MKDEKVIEINEKKIDLRLIKFGKFYDLIHTELDTLYYRFKRYNHVSRNIICMTKEWDRDYTYIPHNHEKLLCLSLNL